MKKKHHKINNNYISKKMDKKIMILDGEKSLLYSLNETGAFIYEEIKKGKDESEIVDAVMAHFTVDEKVAKFDYEIFIEMLKKEKIIVT